MLDAYKTVCKDRGYMADIQTSLEIIDRADKCIVTEKHKRLAKNYICQANRYEALLREFEGIYGLKKVLYEILRTPTGKQIQSGIQIDSFFKTVARLCHAESK